MENELFITKHAIQRGKERFGWKKKVVVKMANKAYYEGRSIDETKGVISSYLQTIANNSVNNVKIYGDNVYLFDDMRLVTLYRLPTNMVKRANAIFNKAEKVVLRNDK